MSLLLATSLHDFVDQGLAFFLAAGFQSVLIALVVGLAIYCLRNRISSQLKYALLLLVLLKFATPPFFHLPTGILSQPVVSQIPIPDNETIRTTVNLLPNDDQAANATTADSQKTNLQSSPKVATEQTETEISTSPIPLQATGTVATIATWKAVLLLTYVAGGLYFLMQVLIGYARAKRVVALASVVEDGEHWKSLQRLAQQLGIRNCPQLRFCDQSESPFAIGVLHPTVVIPKQMLSERNDDGMSIILAHELVHIRRRDLWVGWLETIIHCLWWFHPAMWWLKKELRQTREDCCDDMLLAHKIAVPERYCETLIGSVRTRHDQVLEPVMAGFFGKQHAVARRMRRLMDDSITRPRNLSSLAMGMIVISAAVLLPGMKGQSESGPITKTTLSSSFGGWRNLPFSINEEEEAAIKQCVEMGKTFNHKHNGKRKFYEPETKVQLEEILEQHPKLFYAHHLLATWYRHHDQPELAEKHMAEALSLAPVVLTRQYQTGDGKPAEGLSINSIEIECNRVKRGWLDPSLKLDFYGLVTDAEGKVSLPVYNTVYRLSGFAPAGLSNESESLGWFKSKFRIGELPTVLVWKRGSQPRDFTRAISEVPNIDDAIGTKGNELQVGQNLIRLNNVSRWQSDNSIVSEDGKGAPATGGQVKLPDLSNAAFMDHAIIDLSSSVEDGFAIEKIELREAQTNLPLRSFQNSTSFFQSGDQRIHVLSMFDTLPDKLNLIVRIHNFEDRSFRHKIPAEVGASAEQDGTRFEILELEAGHHRHWTFENGFDGDVKARDGSSEVVFAINGPPEPRFTLWVVLKDGRRWSTMGGFLTAGNFQSRHVTFHVPLEQIDYFELLPYVEATKVYFEDIGLPKRAGALAAIPPIELDVDPTGKRVTTDLFAPLQLSMHCGRGRGPNSSSSNEHGTILYDYDQRNLKDKFFATWQIPEITDFDFDASYSDGMDSFSTSQKSSSSSHGSSFTAVFDAPLESADSITIQIKPAKQ